MFNRDLIARIKEANRIEDVARELGIVLKNNKALCPFHKENHASFNIEPVKQIAKCFSCMPRAVDAIGLVMKFKNISFGEALQYLAKRAGIGLEPLTPEEEVALQKLIKKKEILGITAQFYHDQLVKNNYEDILGYIKERGFKKEILDSFMVGLAGEDGLRDYLVKNGFSEEDGIEAGVLAIWSSQVRDFFQKRLIFPLIVNSEIATITARTLINDSEPKWLHLKGEINNLYNEEALQLEEDILVCEGPTDTLTAIMNGYNAVGILGALAFKPEYYEKFRKAKRVYLCLDGD